MYPHRIRLRGPWECEPLARLPEGPGPLPPPRRMTLPARWAEAGLAGFGGRVRFRRRFGYPGRIDPHERVWLTFAGADDRAAAWLNGMPLGRQDRPGEPFEFEVTGLLEERNELVVEVEGPAGRGGLWGEVALEVRCTAFLRGVRVWAEGDELHAAGEVVGFAEGTLELYVVLGRSTAAYAVARAAPEGWRFHLTGQAGEAGEGARVQVDLVSGATVWYTVERSLARGAPARPG
jgi:hypothetical protein